MMKTHDKLKQAFQIFS